MKLGVGEASYCFDTSALVSLDANYKQSKVFGALWHDIEELMVHGRFVVIDMVYDEVMRHEGSGSSWLKEWLKRNKKECFRDTDEEAMVMARKVIRENKNTGFISEQKMMAGKEEADPYLIGHAYVHGYAIVTLENQTRPNKIPKVAKKYEARGISVLTYLQERGFKLTRQE